MWDSEQRADGWQEEILPYCIDMTENYKRKEEKGEGKVSQ